MLSRENVLAALDMKIERVYVPEWCPDYISKDQSYIFVRGLTGDERDAFESTIAVDLTNAKSGPLLGIRARLVAMAACDADGNALFMEEDIQALGAKSAKAMSRCYDVAARLSGITKGDREELEKNFIERNGDSG